MKKKLSHSNLEANLGFLKRTGKLKKGIKILEIGSGRGVLLNELRRKGYDIVGIEYFQKIIDDAKKIFPGIPIRRVENNKYPYPSGKFDLVLSFDVLEHIPNTKQHLTEVKRVLKKGGHYIFCTPNKWTNIPWEIVNHRSLTKWKGYHVSLQTYSGLKRALKEVGFNASFYDVKVMNEFFLEKVERKMGKFMRKVVKTFNPDRLPVRWRTNYYVIARNV